MSARRLEAAVDAIDAPDVVFAFSRHGARTVRAGGTADAAGAPRELLRYEIGSATKAFTGLLLARLAERGRLSPGAAAVPLLAPGRAAGEHPITLTHLITHTSGLPPLPAGFYPGALPRWRTNPYAHYPARRVVESFLRHRPGHRPGTRWRYSNFAVAVLGHALAAATATPWRRLIAEEVLGPLGLTGTAVRPGPGEATGHLADGTATPALDTGGFDAAGAVRATPGDLLTFLEAHIDPGASPLRAALEAVRRPVLRRGYGHRHVHTTNWFLHDTGHGPLYFHAGATSGQQAFLGFNPRAGTALAALCTRRFRRKDGFVAAAYAVLADPEATA